MYFQQLTGIGKIWTIAFKAASSFFSSLAGFIISGVFLLVMSLMLFSFRTRSILTGNYANMDGLFYMAPTNIYIYNPRHLQWVFVKNFKNGTMELLATKPISDFKIICGKFIVGLF